MQSNSVELLELIDMEEKGISPGPDFLLDVSLSCSKRPDAPLPADAVLAARQLSPAVVAAVPVTTVVTVEGLSAEALMRYEDSSLRDGRDVDLTASSFVAGVTALALQSPRLANSPRPSTIIPPISAAEIVSVVTATALRSPRLQLDASASGEKSVTAHAQESILRDGDESVAGLPLWDHRSDSLHFSPG
jgi:hypothetical protein